MPVVLAFLLILGSLLQIGCLLLFLYRTKINKSMAGLLPWRLGLIGAVLICFRALYEADFILLTGELLLIATGRRLLV